MTHNPDDYLGRAPPWEVDGLPPPTRERNIALDSAIRDFMRDDPFRQGDSWEENGELHERAPRLGRGSVTIEEPLLYTIPAVERAKDARWMAVQYREQAASDRVHAVRLRDRGLGDSGKYFALAAEYDAKAKALEIEHDRLLEVAVIELQDECMSRMEAAPLVEVAPAPPQKFVDKLRVRLGQWRRMAENADYLNAWRPEADPSHHWHEVRRLEERIAEIEHNNFLESELR